MTTSETPLLDTEFIPRWMEKAPSSLRRPSRTRVREDRLFNASDVLAVVPIHMMAMSQAFVYTALIWAGILISSQSCLIAKYIGGIYGLVWNLVIMNTSAIALDIACTLITCVLPRSSSRIKYRYVLALVAGLYAVFVGMNVWDQWHSNSMMTSPHYINHLSVFMKEVSISWTRVLYGSDAYLVGSIQQSLSCCGFDSPLDRPFLALTSNNAINAGRASACSMLPGCKASIQSDLFTVLSLMRWIVIAVRSIQCVTLVVYLKQCWSVKEADGWLYVSFIRNTALLNVYRGTRDNLTSLWSYSKSVHVYSSVSCPRVLAEFEDWTLEQAEMIEPLPTYSPASPPCYHQVIPPPAYTD